jgi:hypothetical protein
MSIFYTPNFLKKVPIVAAASHSNVVYPFVVCPLNTFQVWKGGQLSTNKTSMESRKYHFLLFEIFISTILQIRQEWFKSHSFWSVYLRYIESNTGKNARQGNLRHPRVSEISMSCTFCRCLILFLTFISCF